MSQRWTIAAAAVLVATLVASPVTAAPSALTTYAPGPPGAGLVVSATLSPSMVPPAAPVTVAVRSGALAGHDVTLQTNVGEGWVDLTTATLSGEGRAAFHLKRTSAGHYAFRVVDAATGVVASETLPLTVTTTGLGDRRAYRYLLVSHGAPARWNPCVTVTYRVNSTGVPAGSLTDLKETLRRVSYETGLRFSYRGTTKQVPGAAGFRYDADVVVAFVSAGRSPYLGGSVAGAGGFAPPVRGRGDRPRIVHGFMVFDNDVLAGLPSGFGAGSTKGQALLHEAGHLVGLDHVNAAYQVMRPTLTDMDATLYGAGDLTGLRRIGRRAGCV
jgi:hypothetical protein